MEKVTCIGELFFRSHDPKNIGALVPKSHRKKLSSISASNSLRICGDPAAAT